MHHSTVSSEIANLSSCPSKNVQELAVSSAKILKRTLTKNEDYQARAEEIMTKHFYGKHATLQEAAKRHQIFFG
jgi:hypothetical protein